MVGQANFEKTIYRKNSKDSLLARVIKKLKRTAKKTNEVADFGCRLFMSEHGGID